VCHRADDHGNTMINTIKMFAAADATKSGIMMMIAFITINSGLVPLIEGLCAQILIIKDLRLSVVCVHIFCFFFRKKKYVEEKNS